MKYPAKGKVWFYLGSALMIASLLLFLREILSTLNSGNFVNVSAFYFWFLTAFLASGVFRIYAITPLMSPQFALLVILILFGGSQVSGVLLSLGQPLLGVIAGHFVEIGTFSWAYSRSKAMYDESPL